MKTLYTIFALSFATLFLHAENAPGNTCALEVSIVGVEQVKGTIRIALYKDEATWMQEALRGKELKVEDTTVKCTFKDLPPGQYGLSVLHDENDNGKMDTLVFGIPAEPYGFSNEARGMFGPASWEAARFTVEGISTEVKLRIQ